jgi:hypothetical protein
MTDLIPSILSCALYILVPAAIAASLIFGIHRMQKAARAEIRDADLKLNTQEASDATDRLLARVEDRLRALGAPIP